MLGVVLEGKLDMRAGLRGPSRTARVKDSRCDATAERSGAVEGVADQVDDQGGAKDFRGEGQEFRGAVERVGVQGEDGHAGNEPDAQMTIAHVGMRLRRILKPMTGIANMTR